MSLRDSYFSHSLIFALIFVLQQVIAFTIIPKTNIYYWYIIAIFVLVIGLNLAIDNALTNKRYWHAYIFMIVCVLGAFLSIMKGSPIGSIIFKSFYVIYGYIGFVYLCEKKINLVLFDILLITLYTYFYFTYFVFSSYIRIHLDGALFGHSSSNTISISLFIILFLYFVISKQYETSGSKIKILLFSTMNLIIIVIQGSRAGIVASALLLLITMQDLVNVKLKQFHLSFIITVVIMLFIVYPYWDLIEAFAISEDIRGVVSYEEDIRGYVQNKFLSGMDSNILFLGYKDDYNFVIGITRTFNSFLDFWNQYGFLPFIYLLVLLARRIIYAKYYSLPLFYFLPFLFYSFVETIWGNTYWDILIYLLLFYSYKKDVYVSFDSRFSKVNSEKIKGISNTENCQVT